MIKTINMKNCASYDDEGISICNCNKVNYIYGHNGSGKSTISNYLQTPSLAQFGDCSIEWELGTEAEVLVYNKNFRLKNLQSMPGVFTLGEATAEQIKHLEELKETKEKRRNELLTLKNNIQEKENEKKRLNESFEKDAWDTILKKNEEVFLDAFTGLRGKKSLFAGKVLSVYKKKPTTEFTREELVEKAKTLFAKKPDLLSEITIPDVASLYEIETNEIWGKVIIGNNDVDMAALINALHNSDWVKAGMKYISDDGVCPFCQKKTVDKIVIEQLNQFFSGEYERQNRIVEGLCNQYRTITSALLEQICEWVNTAKAQPIEFDLSELEAYCKTFELLIGKNVELFESKKTEPSRCIDIDLSSDVSKKMLEVMETYNAKIKEHNKLVDDYALQKEKLIEDIWALLIDENSLLLKTYTEADGRICKALIGMSAKEKSLSDEIERLNNEIVEESKNVTSVQPTVDAINRSLKAYGFEGFEIVASKERPNQYQIMRPNGVIATDSLSEGEETFISFLYFVYMTRGGLNTDDKRTSDQVGQKFSVETIADNSPDSKSQVQRYIRLTNLIPDILKLVDEGRIALTPAVELSYLNSHEQEVLHEIMSCDELTPSLSQAQRLRKLSEDYPLTDSGISQIMSEIKGNQKEYVRVPTDSIRKYFTRDTTVKQMEQTIVKAMEFYNKYLERQRNDRDAR